MLNWIAKAERGSPTRTWIYYEPSTDTFNVGYGVCFGKNFFAVPEKFREGVTEDWLRANPTRCPPSPYIAPSMTACGSLLRDKLSALLVQFGNAAEVNDFPQAWQDIVCDLVYNLGPTRVKDSLAFQYMLHENWKSAAAEVCSFRRAGGKIQDGLVYRRAGLVRRALTGIEPDSPSDARAASAGYVYDQLNNGVWPKELEYRGC